LRAAARLREANLLACGIGLPIDPATVAPEVTDRREQ
jgi:hypothetical protein